MRLVDVRHEQTAVFAAEATAKLTRRPGFAALTAGPGVTNGVSAITTAHLNGSPLLVVGGRAPAFRWGAGSLQELDHPPLLAPVTKRAATVPTVGDVAGAVDDAFTLATAAHRGPVFLDVPMDQLFSRAEVELAGRAAGGSGVEPDPDDLAAVGKLLAGAERPVLVIGSDVWTDGAEDAARRLAETTGAPGHHQRHGPRHPAGRAPAARHPGPGRGLRRGRPGRRRRRAARLPARLRRLRRQGRRHAGAGRAPRRLPRPAGPARRAGRLGGRRPDRRPRRGPRRPGRRRVARGAYDAWTSTLQDVARAAVDKDRDLLASDADPVHPARVYGELGSRLADDAVVIGDGGDFVSYAGKYVEPKAPGGWLDPGPYGCLGTGLGYAIGARLARPSGQVVLHARRRRRRASR